MSVKREVTVLHAFARNAARTYYHRIGTPLIIVITFDLRSRMQMSYTDFLMAVESPAWQKCSSKGRTYLM